MFCRHCGNEIENGSRFCSFCGGLIDNDGQIILFHEPNPNIPTSVGESNKSNSLIRRDLIKNDFGILIAFLLMVGLNLFWTIGDLINKADKTQWIDAFFIYIIKPSYVFFWIILIVMAVSSFGKMQRNILLIIGIGVFGFNLYLIYFK